MIKAMTIPMIKGDNKAKPMRNTPQMELRLSNAHRRTIPKVIKINAFFKWPNPIFILTVLNGFKMMSDIFPSRHLFSVSL
jgi:biotin-(acetyl-CoA carboxylase) ligase